MTLMRAKYIDHLLDDYLDNPTDRFMHLGHWDQSNHSLPLRVARSVANNTILNLAPPQHHSAILDLGCGFGGAIEALDHAVEASRLFGLDIDERVLDVARATPATGDNNIEWVLGDGCALPFGDSRFDQIISIEAMMHFSSSMSLFSECYRVLRPGGNVIASCLLVERGGAASTGLSEAEIRSGMLAGFAPWPELALTVAGLTDSATKAGLHMSALVDATAETARCHEWTEPDASNQAAARFSSSAPAQIFSRLHKAGALKVVYFRLNRPSAGTPFGSASGGGPISMTSESQVTGCPTPPGAE